ncbi:hypothetical protein KAH81_08505 [bacterium]|nr:hypothetical protein [bacterium]
MRKTIFILLVLSIIFSVSIAEEPGREKLTELPTRSQIESSLTNSDAQSACSEALQSYSNQLNYTASAQKRALGQVVFTDVANSLTGIGEAEIILKQLSGIGFSSGMGTILDGVGIGVILIQLSFDIANGDKKGAFFNLVKNTTFWSINKWGSSALKVAGVGIILIDYTLNTFAAGIHGQYNEYWYIKLRTEMYKMKNADWDRVFDNYNGVGIKTKEDIHQAVLNTMNSKWDEAVLNAGSGPYAGVGGGATVPNIAVQNNIIASFYKEGLHPVLEQYFYSRKNRAKKQAINGVIAQFKKFQTMVNRDIVFEGYVYVDDDPAEDVEIEIDDILTVTDGSGHYSLKVTLFSLLIRELLGEDTGGKIELEATIEIDDEEITKTEEISVTRSTSWISKNFNFGTKVVLSGSVLNDDNDKPVKKGEISLSGDDDVYKADIASGTYSIDGVKVGDYDYLIVAKGYEDDEGDFKIKMPEGNSFQVKKDFRLTPLDLDVSIISPSDGEIIENNLKPAIAAKAFDGEMGIPKNDITFSLDGTVINSYDYDASSGDITYNPPDDLAETEENKGEHSVSLSALLFEGEPPEVATCDFVCGIPPFITNFSFNPNFGTNPTETVLLSGSFGDNESGPNFDEIVLTVNGEMILPDITMITAKTASFTYSPSDPPEGTDLNAELKVVDFAGFEVFQSAGFVLEEAEIEMVDGSFNYDDSPGNANGYINSGETVALYFNLKNLGTMAAQNVRAVGNSESPWISFTNQMAEFGAIPGESEGAPYSSFLVQVSGSIPFPEGGEPISIPIYFIVYWDPDKETRIDAELVVYPDFAIVLDPVESPIMARDVTITGVVSDKEVTTAMLSINGASRTIEVYDGVFSTPVSLESGDNGVNIIRVWATNEQGERAEDEIEVIAQIPDQMLKVRLTWNTGGTDVDLWVTDPNGEEVGYSNPRSSIGGWLDHDDVNGYGPETFTLFTGPDGNYTIKVHYYSDHDDENAIASGYTVSIIIYEGTDSEDRFSAGGVLGDTGEWNTVAVVSFPYGDDPVARPGVRRRPEVTFVNQSFRDSGRFLPPKLGDFDNMTIDNSLELPVKHMEGTSGNVE